MYANRDGLSRQKEPFYFIASYKHQKNTYDILEDVYNIVTGEYLSEHSCLRFGPTLYLHAYPLYCLYAIGYAHAYEYYCINIGAKSFGIQVDNWLGAFYKNTSDNYSYIQRDFITYKYFTNLSEFKEVTYLYEVFDAFELSEIISKW